MVEDTIGINKSICNSGYKAISSILYVIISFYFKLREDKFHSFDSNLSGTENLLFPF